MESQFKSVNFSNHAYVDFSKTLTKRVKAYFEERKISMHANAKMVFKTIFMVLLYLVPFTLLFFIPSAWLTLLCWVIMGFGMAGIGLSIMHDANHGAYSTNSRVNYFLGAIINMIGGNPANWRIQHNVLHHTYTNIDGYDEDITPPVKLLRFSPYSPWRKIHKFQYIYAWAFYSLMTVMWFSSKDFQQAIRYKKKGLSNTQGINFNKHLRDIIFGKVFYISVFVAVPMIFAPAYWYIQLIGFVVMQLLAGLILASVFQPAHVVPTSSYDKPDDSGNVAADWKAHQLYNTANFATNSKLFSWYVGGLNFQVEHHLFPNICHIHYKDISKIVEKTAKEFNLPYSNNRTFASALGEHVKMLKMLGREDCPRHVHI